MFYIGIVLENETFKVAVIQYEKQMISVDSLETFAYGPDNVKLFYNLPPFHTGKKTWIISGLSGDEAFIRKLHLPLKEKRKILAALPFQLETLIPFSADETVVCSLLKSISKQMTAVTLIATNQKYLTAHLKSLEALDIVPDIISCFANALARFTHWQFPEEKHLLAFHIQEEKLWCVLTEEGQLSLAQTIAFQDKANLALEIGKFSVFLKQKGAADEQTSWILTGNLDYEETIQSIFSEPPLPLSDPSLAAYAIPLGLAIDGLKNDASTVQFRQKQFTAQHTLRDRSKKMQIYLAACFIAACLMFVSNSFLINKKQRALSETLQNYLPTSLASRTHSSVEDFENTLFEWEQSLNRQKNPLVFIPNIPKVSDVLAWISSHPSFSTEDGAKKEGMELLSLHYHLSKYPKIGETSAPYLAQVELEFTSNIPRTARDFHEALLKGDPIVNGKKEVKWQVQNQTYHTAFEVNRGITP